MTVLRYRDQIIQVDEVSDVSAEGMVYECWDITPEIGEGMLFRLVESGDTVLVEPYKRLLDLGLLEEVAQSVRQ
jgi:hypothetical protein